METSLLLARIFGAYMTIVSIAYITNQKLLKSMLITFSKRIPLFLSGIAALVFGVWVVSIHNIWSADWRVIITVIGWISALKGVIRIFMPNITLSWFKNAKKGGWVTWAFWVSFLLGAYLLYIGFLG